MAFLKASRSFLVRSASWERAPFLAFSASRARESRLASSERAWIRASRARTSRARCQR